jgi:PPOX class probable F420-dependent enzyme
VRLSEEAVARALEAWPVGRLALIDASGAPRQVPVVFARAEGALWSPVDGKPKRDGEPARLRRVAAEPRVSLLLDAYDDDWTRLWWIEVQGRAAVVRGPSEDAPPIAAAAAALRGKYPQYAATPLFAAAPTLIRIDIERIHSWSFDRGRSFPLKDSPR